MLKITLRNKNAFIAQLQDRAVLCYHPTIFWRDALTKQVGLKD